MQIWLNSNWESQNQDSDIYYGSYGVAGFVHEIGHSLGLSHPGTYNAGNNPVTYAANAEFTQDNRQYTIMSYFGGYNLSTNSWTQDGTSLSWYYPSTPMVYDIAAVQATYGTDYSTRAGNSTYGFNITSDVAARSMNGQSVYSFSQNTHAIFTIWDGGGTDTLDCSGYSASQTINLIAGNYSSIGGMNSNIGIAYNCTIENAAGGSGLDTITGNGADNILRGNGGNDTIDGGTGTDSAVFSGVRSSYTLTSLGGNSVRVVGPDGTDMLTNVELLVFSDQTIGWPPAANAGSISIDDVVITEGDGGAWVAYFTVTRTGGTAAFSVNYATTDGTATAASGDYTAASGTLNFAANATQQIVGITINGDIRFEPDETFFLTLSGATNGATFTDNSGRGTIVNNDVNHAPVVTVTSANVTASAGQVLAASSLFSATDADGDTLIYYLYDNTIATSGGHFEVNGTVVPSDVMYAVTAAQLAQTTFVAGAAGKSDDLFVKVFDGYVYTDWSEFHVSGPPANRAPVLTVPSANVAATAGQVLSASSLFSATDADGDTLTYYLYDNTRSSGGHFEVNGTVVPSDVMYAVTAAQLAQTSFVAGAAGKSDDLFVKVFDGHVYTNWGEFHVNVPAAVNYAPVVTVPSANVSANAGQALAASSLFSATDLNGDALTYYLYNNTVSTTGGHFTVNGAVVPRDVMYAVSAAQLALTTFVAGDAGSSDDLFIKVFDGHTYTNWSEFHVNVIGANRAPTVTAPPANLAVNPGQVLQLSSLFNANDLDGDTLTYYVYDNTVATSGGHFSLNGTTLPSDRMVALTATQFMQATFVAGAAGKSDDLNITVFDGHTYISWSQFHVNATGAGANQAPVVVAPPASVSAVPGQALQLSSLFSATDLDGDVLTYYVYDNTIATSGGHSSLNGTTLPSDTMVALTAAQFAQATFVAGLAGTNDNLDIKVFDGHVYSNWSDFHVVV